MKKWCNLIPATEHERACCCGEIYQRTPVEMRDRSSLHYRIIRLYGYAIQCIAAPI